MSSTTNDFLHGYDPTDTADTATTREMTPFDYNVSSCTGGSTYTFENSGDSILRFRFRIEEGPNKGMQATLQYPAAPRLNKRTDTGTYSDDLTEEEKAACIKAWQRGLARIQVALKLPAPTVLDDTWAAKAEGAQAITGCYTDNKGFGAVRCFQNQQRKDYRGDKPFEYAIGIVGAEEAAKDRKGVIPGLTALEQARQQIAKWEAKQSS